MSDPVRTIYGEVTLIDVRLASAFYPILVELAKHKHCLTYGELIERAKELHPDKADVQNAIPVGIGRRLEVVKYFTEQHCYPDLTSLIIGKGSGEVGEGFRGDPNRVREEVYAFDWNNAATDFDGFVVRTTKQVNDKGKPKPKKPEAESLMYAHYKLHGASLPSNIKTKRNLIVKLLMEGVTVEDAFSRAITTSQTG